MSVEKDPVREYALMQLREMIEQTHTFIDATIALLEQIPGPPGAVSLENRVATLAKGLMVCRSHAEVAFMAAVMIERIAAREALDGGLPR